MSGIAAEELECIICYQMMNDPVLAADTHTYCRVCIEKWFSGFLPGESPRSPTTNKPMSRELTPNFTIKKIIASLQQEKKTPVPATAPAVCTIEGDFTVALNSVNTDEGNEWYAEITPPLSAQPRQNISIVFVVDSSGSMRTEADLKHMDDREKTGLSILDITKHAVTTCLEALDDGDRACLITFSDEPVVRCNCKENPYVQCTRAGKKRFSQALANVKPRGQTNLWMALHRAMTMQPDYIILLTDGRPNPSPPRGERAMLDMFLDEHPSSTFSIHTYGFGYSLDSKLLRDIAAATGGMYHFIPDASFVGTIFVHSIANILATAAKNAGLFLEVGTTMHFKDVGELVFGQSRTVRFDGVEVPEGTVPTITLKCSLVGSPDVIVRGPHPARTTGGHRLLDDISRLALVDSELYCELYQGEGGSKYKALPVNFKKLEARLTNLPTVLDTTPSPFYSDIMLDVRGQIREAMGEEAFQRWGYHFLLSLKMAHALQRGLNFKDPGPLHYGGSMFRTLRDTADKLFNQLPPPKPSLPRPSDTPQYRGGGRRLERCSRPKSPPPPINMERFNNPNYGGCFDGNGMVAMHNGPNKMVRDLKKGDCVAGGSTVVCVVRTPTTDCVDMVDFGAVKLTPWHPIRRAGRMGIEPGWAFPCEIKKPTKTRLTDGLYNVVLDSEHALHIEEVECITLGHGFQGDVIGHEYFGTEKVLNDLRALPGWDEGVVTITGSKRDAKTGLVSGLF